jgi:DNA-directed RNA polymerase beta subunit
MLNSQKQSGNVMKATIPYIKVDIPIWVVFRALGVMSDRDILEHICYDMQDMQMLEMLKPCIDDGFVIQDRDVRHLGILLPDQLNSTLDRPGLHRQPRHHNGSLEGASYSVRTRDSTKGDASARINVRGIGVKEGLLLWIHDPQTSSCCHGTKGARRP